MKRLDPQGWPWLDRPRVLVEDPDADSGLEAADLLRHAGCSVAVCRGPAANQRCPLECSEECALVEGADVIVTSLGGDVLDALCIRYPERVVDARGLPPERLLAAVHAAIPD